MAVSNVQSKIKCYHNEVEHVKEQNIGEPVLILSSKQQQVLSPHLLPFLYLQYLHCLRWICRAIRTSWQALRNIQVINFLPLLAPFASSHPNHAVGVYKIRRRRYALSPQGLYGINTKCCMLSSRRICTLARDAIRDSVAITYNARGALITYQAFFVAWIKIKATPKGRFNFWRRHPESNRG